MITALGRELRGHVQTLARRVLAVVEPYVLPHLPASERERRHLAAQVEVARCERDDLREQLAASRAARRKDETDYLAVCAELDEARAELGTAQEARDRAEATTHELHSKLEGARAHAEEMLHLAFQREQELGRQAILLGPFRSRIQALDAAGWRLARCLGALVNEPMPEPLPNDVRPIIAARAEKILRKNLGHLQADALRELWDVLLRYGSPAQAPAPTPEGVGDRIAELQLRLNDLYKIPSRNDGPALNLVEHRALLLRIGQTAGELLADLEQVALLQPGGAS